MSRILSAQTLSTALVVVSLLALGIPAQGASVHGGASPEGPAQNTGEIDDLNTWLDVTGCGGCDGACRNACSLPLLSCDYKATCKDGRCTCRCLGLLTCLNFSS